MDQETSFYMDQILGTSTLETSLESDDFNLLGTSRAISMSLLHHKRTISSLVRILEPEENQQSCVFQLCPNHTLFDANSSIDEMLSSPEPAQRPVENIGIIVVTPNVIGKQIPAHVTLETARLVSKVAHLGTEDWLRTYRNFDGTEWNGGTMLLEEAAQEMASSTNSHGVVLSTGKTDLALLELWIRKAFVSLDISGEQVCTISMLQLVDKTLVDLLDPEGSNLRVHHIDQCGAVVKNLTQSCCDSAEGCAYSLKSGIGAYDGKSIVVCTLTVWDSALAQHLDQVSKCRYLQFVHLPSSPRVDRNTIAVRQSLSSLGAILRQLVLSTNQQCSYRETTLTELLQRTLSSPTTNVVILGTVSSNVESYEQTIYTLNYIDRLFGYSKNAVSDLTSINAEEFVIPDDLTTHSAFLKSVVSDPRQRLAALGKKFRSPTNMNQSGSPGMLKTPEEKGYNPTNYMDIDPLQFQSEYYKDPEEKKGEPAILSEHANQEDSESWHLEEAKIEQPTKEAEPVFQSPKRPLSVMFECSNVSLDYSSNSPMSPTKEPGLRKHIGSPLDSFLNKGELDPVPRDSLESQPDWFHGEDGESDGVVEIQEDQMTNQPNKFATHNTESVAWMKDQLPNDPLLVSADTTPDEASPRRKFQPSYNVMKRDALSSKIGTVPNMSRRPPTYRVDSKLSLNTTDTEEAGGPLVTVPTVPSSVLLRPSLMSPPGFAKNLHSPISPRYSPPQIGRDSLTHDERSQPSPWRIQSIYNSTNDSTALEDTCKRELLDLRKAVEEMKQSGNPAWSDRLKSLERLQQKMLRQHTMNQKTVDELNEVEEQLRIAERQYKDQLDKYSSEAEKERCKVQDLQEKLEKALEESTSLNEVAEQAVGDTEQLKRELDAKENDIKRLKRELSSNIQNYETVAKRNEKLAIELKGVRAQGSDMVIEHDTCEAIISDLELKVKQITTERDRLKEEREKNGAEMQQLRLQMDELKLESDDIAAVQQRLKAKEIEVERLRQSNEGLMAKLFEGQQKSSAEVESREAKIGTLQLEMKRLEKELTSASRRLQEERGEHSRVRSAVEEEQSMMREKIKQIELERDNLQQLRDTDMSELETLKLESALRADLEKRLRTASVEIDRLRSERSKVHNEMAAVRAAAAADIDDKEGEVQQLKLELHQSKLDQTSLRRRLGDAQTENDRIRVISDEEQRRVSSKLSSANEEIAHLRMELADAVRGKHGITNEASELKVAVQARDEEIAMLSSQLERLNHDQTKSKRENKKLREDLYMLRDNTRAQVVEIYEQKKQSEMILDVEREQNSTLKLENEHLKESLERLRRENEADHGGLDSFQEHMSKLMAEKSEALTKSIHLEKQLKESNLTVQDLQHELELAKLRSNDDLLRKTKEEFRAALESNAELSELIQQLKSERYGIDQGVEALRLSLAKTEKEKTAAQSKATALVSSLEEIEKLHSDLQKELEKATSIIKVKSDALIKAQNEIKFLRDEGIEMKGQCQKLLGSKKELEEHVTILMSKLRIKDHTKDEFDQERKSFNQQREEIQHQMLSIKEHAQNVQRELESTKTQLEEIHRELNVTLENREELRLTLETTIHTKEDLRDELESVTRMKEDLSRRLEMSLRSKEELCHELEVAKQRKEESERAHIELEAKVARDEIERTKILEEQNRLRSDQETLRTMEHEIQSLRKELVAQPDHFVSMIEFRAEQQRNNDLNDLISTLAKRAKASTEHREKIIRNLNAHLVQVTEQKEAEIQGLRLRLLEWERSVVREEHESWRSKGHRY